MPSPASSSRVPSVPSAWASRSQAAMHICTRLRSHRAAAPRHSSPRGQVLAPMSTRGSCWRHREGSELACSHTAHGMCCGHRGAGGEQPHAFSPQRPPRSPDSALRPPGGADGLRALTSNRVYAQAVGSELSTGRDLLSSATASLALRPTRFSQGPGPAHASLGNRDSSRGGGGHIPPGCPPLSMSHMSLP